MKYVDMVLSETLRKWTPGPISERQVNRPYVIENYDGTQVYLKKGEGISIPVYALHRDAKYFPNPDKFDPERFCDENKHNIKQGTYMPFGIGPSE